MVDQPHQIDSKPTENDEFYQVLSDFIRRRDSGEHVDIEVLCKQHPEHAEALQSYVAGDGLLNAMLEDGEEAVSSAGQQSSQSISVQAVETIRPGAAQRTDTPLGEEFGRYRIVRMLGEGAMGSIYLALDTNLDREVALKIPKLTGLEKGDFLQRFSREAKAAARLDHPNVCTVYDADEKDGTPYITMAYIDGQPLSRFIGTEEFDDQRRVAEMVREIAKGLAHAHQQSVLHRDLKPGNVLIQKDGSPCITDFGLARRVDSGAESRITHEGTIVGTPAYMSPEQIEGNQERIGPATDIYALGAMFYELLTHQLPFQGTVMSMLGQALRDRPKPLTSIRSNIDPDLQDLCLKMLEKDPQKRPVSMTDVADELDKWLQNSTPEKQAAQAKTKKNLAKLEANKTKIEELIQRGQYAAAAGALEKMIALKNPQAAEYVSWAKEKLPEVQQMPEKLQQGIPSLIKTAKRFISRHDYAQAAELLSKIPVNLRTSEAQRLLEKAIDLQDEADLLLADLQDCVKTLRYKGIEDNLNRFLELKPGNKFAQNLHTSLTSYGTGKHKKTKFRFDNKGRLLPAGDDSIWDSFGLWGAIVFLFVFAGMSYGIVLYLGDDKQKIAVEVDEEWLKSQGGNISLAVDGKEYAISGPGIDIKVSLGKRGFSVKSGDTVIHNPKEFTIEKEGRKILRIDATGMHFGTDGSKRDPGEQSIATRTQSASRKVTGRQTTLIPLKAGVFPYLAFSPEGDRLATFKRYTTVYDIEKAEQLATYEFDYTNTGCWHPSGGRLVCGSAFSQIELLNATTLRKDKEFPVLGGFEKGIVSEVAITKDGHYLASMRTIKEGERYVELVDTQSGELKLSYTQSENTGGHTGLFFDEEQKRLISISRGKDYHVVVKTVQLDEMTVQQLPIDLATDGTVNGFSAKYNRVIVADNNAVGTAVVFDGTSGARIGTIGENRRGMVDRIAVPDTGRLIAMANSELNTVELIDLETLRTVGEIDLGDHFPDGLSFDGPGNRLAMHCLPEAGHQLPNRERTKFPSSIRIFELSESNTDPAQSVNVVNVPRTPLPDGPPGNTAVVVSLFNGKDLTGWNVVGARDAWQVVNGILVTQGPGKGYLQTEKDYANFEFEAEYRLTKGANSGIYFLASADAASSSEAIELQLVDDNSLTSDAKNDPSILDAALHKLAAADARATNAIGEWNRLTVRIQNRNLQVTLNGRMIHNVSLDKLSQQNPRHQGVKRPFGRIALQHWNENRVDFRNIRIRDLDTSKAMLPIVPVRNAQPSAVETRIRQSLILNRPTGSSKSFGIAVLTTDGICTVRAGSFKTVELSTEAETKTVVGNVATRRPFPFCWIDAKDLSSLDRKPAASATSPAFKGGDSAYIAYKRSGKVHVYKGTITEFGAFKADFDYSPTQRGIVQVGPVFTAEGNLAGYGVRMDLGNDIKIYRIRRQ